MKKVFSFLIAVFVFTACKNDEPQMKDMSSDNSKATTTDSKAQKNK